MHEIIFTGVIQLDSYEFIRIMFVFLTLLALLFAFILGFALYKRRVAKKKKNWQEKIATMISHAIFATEEDDEPGGITKDVEKLLHNSTFRQYVIDELIHAKKNLSGSSTTNLKKFYEALELNNDSFKKLNNAKWHIKAKGIQELAIMKQIKYVKEIFRLTNNENELVRNEAQGALVNFYGFPGLRFLNVTVHPISQWQQIQLLNKLSSAKPQKIDAIKKWLQSPNESVIIFSLKLATFYHCFAIYDTVINCLQHTSMQVKFSALEYLKVMPQEDTPNLIVNNYASGNKMCKLETLDILKDIGSQKQMLFLLKQLHNSDDDIKAAAAKTLASLHPMGAACLKTHLFADENPWKAIFLQIENERAA